MRVDLDLHQSGIVGRGRRSRSNSENCLCSPVWTSGAEQVDIY